VDSTSTRAGLSALNRTSSTSSSPRQSTSAWKPPPKSHSLSPTLSPPPRYDFRTEKKVIKSILKKSTDYSDPSTLEIGNDDLCLDTSLKKRITFASETKLRSTCPWFGGKDTYYQWATPRKRIHIVSETPVTVESQEFTLQEQRQSYAPEFTCHSNPPDDPSMMDLSHRVFDISTNKTKVIPWSSQDDGKADEKVAEGEVGNNEEEEGAEDDTDDTESVTEEVDKLDEYDDEITVPDLNKVLSKDERSMYIAIWDHVSKYIGDPKGSLSVSLSAVGAVLSSTFGRKYLSKCPGKNLKRVLLSHPEGKFHVTGSQLTRVGMCLVRSDVWNEMRSFCEIHQKKHHLLTDVDSYLMVTFGDRYLRSIAQPSLEEVVKSHPARLFELYEVNEDGYQGTAVRLRAENRPDSDQLDGNTIHVSSFSGDGVHNNMQGEDMDTDEDPRVSRENATLDGSGEDDNVRRNSEDIANDNVINLSHITESFKNNVDPYECPWSDEEGDDSDVGTESNANGDRHIGRVSSINDDVYGDSFLRDTVLSCFVEQIKSRGITGLRKSQFNASLVQLYHQINSRGAYDGENSPRAEEVGRDELLKAVKRRYQNIYVQEQYPSKNHLVYYIDNPCVNFRNWKKEVTCIYLPQMKNGKCKITSCEFAHQKIYDDHERGFVDSTTKRNISSGKLRDQILTVIRDARGVVFNFDVFERFYKAFGCRLCFGDRVTICNEAKALHELLSDCREVRSYADPRLVGINVMAYTWASTDPTAATKRKRREDFELEEEAEIMSRARDRLFRLVKEFGKKGIRLEEIPRKYYDKYGEHCRFTIGGETDLDIESIIEKIPGIRREKQYMNKDDIEEFNRSGEEIESGEAWGKQSSRGAPSKRRNSRSSLVFYYDENKSYLDEDGCLDVNAVGKMSKGDNYHVKQMKRQETAEYKRRRIYGNSNYNAEVYGRNRDRLVIEVDAERSGRDRYEAHSPRRDHRTVSVEETRHDSHRIVRYGSNDGGHTSPPRSTGDDGSYRYDRSSSSRELSSPRSGSRRGDDISRKNSSPCQSLRSSSATSKRHQICAYFNTARGCRNGKDCTFLHQK